MRFRGFSTEPPAPAPAPAPASAPAPTPTQASATSGSDYVIGKNSNPFPDSYTVTTSPSSPRIFFGDTADTEGLPIRASVSPDEDESVSGSELYGSAYGSESDGSVSGSERYASAYGSELAESSYGSELDDPPSDSEYEESLYDSEFDGSSSNSEFDDSASDADFIAQYEEANLDSPNTYAQKRAGYASMFAQDPKYDIPPPSDYPDSDASSFTSEGTTESGTVTVFHGTTQNAAYNIRDNGFQMRAKHQGATEGAGLDGNLTFTERHHFFSKDPEEAKEMAKLTAELRNEAAAIVKAKLPVDYAETLVPDFAMEREKQTAFVSKYDTPASFVTETRKIRF